MNHDTLLRFMKDQKVPIIIFDEPYFSYFLNLYDKDFQTKKAYDLLCETVAQFDSESAFLEKYYEIRNEIIDKMKELPEYTEFLSCDMSRFKIEEPKLPNANKGDVYKMPNIGSYYISIDLQKANFQMLKKFNPNLVLGANTYEELISQFTDMEYFKQSKYIRQVIFGNMKPDRQTTMERYYTKQILDLILKELDLELKDIAVFTYDEVVIRQQGFVSENKTEAIKNLIKEKLDLDVSVTSFRLAGIGDKEYFVKEKQDGSFSMKKVPSIYFAQAYKKYRGLEINENDLLFFYEGNLAKFLKPLF